MTQKIPKFKNYQEEASFWDKNDFSDFRSELKETKLMVNLAGPKADTLTVRLQPNLKTKLSDIAQEMGIQASTLARMWLIEKLKTIHN